MCVCVSVRTEGTDTIHLDLTEPYRFFTYLPSYCDVRSLCIVSLFLAEPPNGHFGKRALSVALAAL